MTLARLWLRTNRQVLLLFGLVTIVASVAGVVYAMTVSCDPGLTHRECERYLNGNPPSTAATAILAILPILLGLMLGIGAVGGELENGTAAFAWSIAGDRRRWLAERVLLDALYTAAFALVCGTVSAVIVAKLNPGHDIAATFIGYGLWGPILVARAVCGYAIGLGIGALTGRVVGAVALALLLVTVATLAALIVGRSFEPARIIASDDPSVYDALPVDSGVLTHDGKLVSWFECVKAEPTFKNDPDASQQSAWELTNCPSAGSYVPGSRMPMVEMRESAVLGIVVLVFAGAAFATVANRRL